MGEGDLVIVISQSGETLDSMAALREAKKRGARILSIVNVVGSSIARESHDVLYTWAGPEIAVATTKAYSTQMVVLNLLGLYFGDILGTENTICLTDPIYPVYIDSNVMGGRAGQFLGNAWSRITYCPCTASNLISLASG